MEMNDKEFLDYVEAHSKTERAGFVTEHVARFARLAGDDRAADQWSQLPNAIISMHNENIQWLIDKARENLKD